MTEHKRPVRIIALMNQKGGVGKTTTTVNLGAAIAESGRRVLLIDMDPQAHLSLHLGVDPAQTDATVYDLLTDESVSAFDAIREVDKQLAVLPAEVDLAGAEQELAGAADRHDRLKRKLRPVVDAFDYVLLDCPPSLGLLTVNGLVTAGEVIVPMQAHFLALQGLSKLLETVQIVRQNMNTSLRVSGVVLAMHEAHTNLAGEVVADLENFFTASRKLAMPWSNAVIYQPPIRRNIKLAECPSFGQTIFQYEATCPGAADYRALAKAVMDDARASAPARRSEVGAAERVVHPVAPAPASAPAADDVDDADASDASDGPQVHTAPAIPQPQHAGESGA